MIVTMPSFRSRESIRTALNMTEHAEESKRIPRKPLVRSRSIPFPSEHIRRTPSELQLCEDEAHADFRDYCMFQRISQGLKEHKRTWNDCDDKIKVFQDKQSSISEDRAWNCAMNGLDAVRESSHCAPEDWKEVSQPVVSPCSASYSSIASESLYDSYTSHWFSDSPNDEALDAETEIFVLDM